MGGGGGGYAQKQSSKLGTLPDQNMCMQAEGDITTMFSVDAISLPFGCLKMMYLYSSVL